MSGIFPSVEHEADLCVVGGGMSGYAAALAAANCGVKVVLMHDRPVLGGNASSEIRMHICGADRHNAFPHWRETGLTEELRLRNCLRNPEGSYGIWDTLLYEDMRYHPNITLLLNCSCLDAKMENGRMVSITGWMIQSEEYHTVRARWFADCSGDGILAPLTGAAFRIGREAKAEFGEPNGPAVADDKTMGHSLMFSVRKCDRAVEFIPPVWANKYESCDDLPYGLRGHGHDWFDGKINYWWLELGGEHDTIHDTSLLRDELLKIIYGVWDHLKNHCPGRAKVENYTLDWLQFLPAKRESRRYVGDYVLTQNDLAACRNFPDDVAYGGWTMDDHDPAGFYAVRSGRPATTFNELEPGYGIPWRALYSRNVPNLLFAGRNASCTHMAMSSTRVMATCMVMGQAVGTGVGLMLEKGVGTPAGLTVENGLVGTLQQRLLRDDCYLPKIALKLPAVAKDAMLTASAPAGAEQVRDGWARRIKDESHGWACPAGGGWLEYALRAPQKVEAIFIALDSMLEKDFALSWHYRSGALQMPERLPKELKVEIKIAGAWQTIIDEKRNACRHYRLPVEKTIEGARLTIGALWGEAQPSLVYAFCLL